MRIAPLGLGLILVLSCICLQAQTQLQKVTVTGKLTRVAATGGESTGWAMQLDSELTVESKPVHSIELDALEVANLEKYENKRVKVVGKIATRRAWRPANGLSWKSLRSRKSKPSNVAPVAQSLAPPAS